jgi:hypothetical protein
MQTLPDSANVEVSCDALAKICPVEVHIGRRRLLREIVIRSADVDSAIDFSDLAVRLRGLVDQPWPLKGMSVVRSAHKTVITDIRNPPIAIPVNMLEETGEHKSVLELFLSGHRVSNTEVTLLPPLAVPTSVASADALAALVLPNAPEIADLVRGARIAIDPKFRQLGFPGLSPIDAIGCLYSEILKRFPHSYAWEPGPWKANTAAQVARSPAKVVSEAAATCLDTALIVCGAIERIRRLPFLLGIRIAGNSWHIVAGIRLRDDDVGSSALITDSAVVRQECRLGRSLLVDPEAIVRGHTLELADSIARKKLVSRDLFLVDVQAARESDIWPLPISHQPSLSPAPSFDLVKPQVIEYPAGIPSGLVDDFARGRVVILIGDSIEPSMVHSRSNLAAHLSKEVDIEVPDLLDAATLFEERHGREALLSEALSFLKQGLSAPAEIYRKLAELPVDTIVSFFPDALLERSLQEAERPFRPLVDDEDLVKFEFTPENRRLYLLGGSGTSGRGLSLTRDAYHSWLRRISLVALGLRERLASATLLLLRCDLSDLTLRTLYVKATAHRASDLRPVFLAGCTGADQWIESASVLSLPVHGLLTAIVEAVPGAASAPLSPPAKPIHYRRAPYKFLDYFEPEDIDIFFGREDDVKRLLAELRAAPGRIVVLCGRSGVGKTSLVKAALVVALGHDALPLYVRSTSTPEDMVCASLLELDANQGAGTRRSLRDLCNRVAGARKQEIVVIMDQFEEALIKSSGAVLSSFFGAVLECVSAEPCKFVFVVREDFLGRLAEYCRVLPRLLSTVCSLGELPREAARDAILQPPRQLGLEVKDELADAILDDLSADSIMPAHLQIICEQVYQRRQVPKKIRVEDYESLGRARLILSGYLETAVRAMPEGVEKSTRALLGALVTSEHTKDLITIPELAERSHLSERHVRASIHELIHTHRLVREVQGDPMRFELSHEILAESVSSWLDATELRVRTVQEIVDQETAAARKLGDSYRIPEDRLALIEEYRTELTLHPEAIRLVVDELVRSSLHSEFWFDKLKSTSNEVRIDCLIFRPARSSVESFQTVLGWDLSTLLRGCSPVPFPADVALSISRAVLTADAEVMPAVLAMVRLDSSRATEALLVAGCRDMPSSEIRRITRAYGGGINEGEPWDESELESPADERTRLFVALVREDPAVLIRAMVQASVDDFLLDEFVVTLVAFVSSMGIPTSARSDLAKALRDMPRRRSAMFELIRWSLIASCEPTNESHERIGELLSGSLDEVFPVSTSDSLKRALTRAVSFPLLSSTRMTVSRCGGIVEDWTQARSQVGPYGVVNPSTFEFILLLALRTRGPGLLFELFSSASPKWLILKTLVALVLSEELLHFDSSVRKTVVECLSTLDGTFDPLSRVLRSWLEASCLLSNAAERRLQELIERAEVELHQTLCAQATTNLQIALLLAVAGSCSVSLASGGRKSPTGIRIETVLEQYIPQHHDSVQQVVGKILGRSRDDSVLRLCLRSQRTPVVCGILDELSGSDRERRIRVADEAARFLRRGPWSVRLSAAHALVGIRDDAVIGVVRSMLLKPNLSQQYQQRCVQILASSRPSILAQLGMERFLVVKELRVPFLQALESADHTVLCTNAELVLRLVELADRSSHVGLLVCRILARWGPGITAVLDSLARDADERLRAAIDCVNWAIRFEKEEKRGARRIE